VSVRKLIPVRNYRGTDPVCHTFLNDSGFYQFLFHIDQDNAAEIAAGGFSETKLLFQFPEVVKSSIRTAEKVKE